MAGRFDYSLVCSALSGLQRRYTCCWLCYNLSWSEPELVDAVFVPSFIASLSRSLVLACSSIRQNRVPLSASLTARLNHSLEFLLGTYPRFFSLCAKNENNFLYWSRLRRNFTVVSLPVGLFGKIGSLMAASFSMLVISGCLID